MKSTPAQLAAAKNYSKRNPHITLLGGARRRSRLKGLVCTITPSDVVIPERCPVLDIPIFRGGRNSPNSPSIDRIIPSLGYTPENIVVISLRANMLKRDATIEEMRLLYEFYKELI